MLVPGAQPLGFSVNDITVTEGNDGTRQAVFTVTRSSGGWSASVRYATADCSATLAGIDYQPASGTLSFVNGETRKTISVLVNGDRVGEPDESFALNLTNPTGAVIADGQGKAAVLDDEPRIYITGQIVNPEGNEKKILLIAADLTVPSTQTVTVNYATADGTAVAQLDYKPTAGMLTFDPGETRKIIEIRLPKDTTPEPIVEAFFVDLSNASSDAVILKRGVVHIVDDDPSQAQRVVEHSTTTLAASGISYPARKSVHPSVFAAGSSVSDVILRDDGYLDTAAVWELPG